MIRVAVSVEGQTEDEFCKRILSPYFRQTGIELSSIIVTTKRQKCGIKHKGGCINLDRVKSEVSKLLPNFDYVTTFYDLYGFDIDQELTANELELKIGALFTNRRFIPYIQQYEFETLLFSKPLYYADYFDKESVTKQFETIINHCGGVEEINHSKETAPSKRLNTIFKQYDEQYDKVFHGYSIIEDIGLESILSQCTRFKNWVNKIQSLSHQTL